MGAEEREKVGCLHEQAKKHSKDVTPGLISGVTAFLSPVLSTRSTSWVVTESTLGNQQLHYR